MVGEQPKLFSGIQRSSLKTIYYGVRNDNRGLLERIWNERGVARVNHTAKWAVKDGYAEHSRGKKKIIR
jgi:hypothetical protein